MRNVKQWPKLHRAIELRDELHRWSTEAMGTIDYESQDNLQDAHDPLSGSSTGPESRPCPMTSVARCCWET